MILLVRFHQIRRKRIAVVWLRRNKHVKNWRVSLPFCWFFHNYRLTQLLSAALLRSPIRILWILHQFWSVEFLGFIWNCSICDWNSVWTTLAGSRHSFRNKFLLFYTLLNYLGSIQRLLILRLHINKCRLVSQVWIFFYLRQLEALSLVNLIVGTAEMLGGRHRTTKGLNLTLLRMRQCNRSV